MRKKINFIYILFLLTNICVNGQNKIFVGYSNGSPVFDSFSEKTLYLYENKKGLEIIKKYPKKYLVYNIENNFISFVEKLDEGYCIVIDDGKNETRLIYKNRPTCLSFDDKGVLYFTDYRTSEIVCIKKDKIEILGVKGYVVGIFNNHLYYTDISDSETIHANVDLFEKSLLDLSKNAIKILSNISGEAMRISPDGDYIYDMILKEGSFKPFLYNRKNNELKIIETVDKKFLTTVPFFSFQEYDVLIFYDPETIDLMKYQI